MTNFSLIFTRAKTQLLSALALLRRYQHPLLIALVLVSILAISQHAIKQNDAGLPALNSIDWLMYSLLSSGEALFQTITAFQATGWQPSALLGVAFIALVLLCLLFKQIQWAFATFIVFLVTITLIEFLRFDYLLAIPSAVALGIALVSLQRRIPSDHLSLRYPLVLLAIISLSFSLRLWRIDEIPHGFGQHGVVHMVDGHAIEYSKNLVPRLMSGDFSAISEVSLDQHIPLAFIHSVAFYFTGHGFLEAKLVQVVFGTLAVLAIYFLGYYLAGEIAGLTAAALLGTSWWHIAFSRYDDAEHVLPILQTVLALLFTIRAAKFNRIIDYALCGLLTAFGWYIYATSQIVTVVVICFQFYKYVLSRAQLSRSWRGLLVFWIVFGVASIPHLNFYLHKATSTVPIRAEYTTETNSGPYAIVELKNIPSNFAAAARQLFIRTNDGWVGKDYEAGFLGLIEASFFISALVFLIFQLRDPAFRDSAVLLIFFLILTPWPGVLTAEVVTRRLMLCGLWAILAAGIVGQAIYATIPSLQCSIRTRIRAGLVSLILLLAVGAVNFYIYVDLPQK